MDMTRDYEVFPGDDSGDALWRMYVSKDNLAQKRECDFWVIFSEEQNAMDFAINGLKRGWKISVSKNDDAHFIWQVGVHVVLLPNYKEITSFEHELERTAIAFQGKNDGWGCFEA